MARARAAAFVVRTALQADRWRALAVFVLQPALSLSSVLLGLWLKLLADAVLGGRYGLGLFAAGALAVSATAQHLFALALCKVRATLGERTSLLLDQQILEAVASLPGVEHHERPEYLDKLEMLRAERSTAGQAVSAVVMSLSTLVQALGTAVLLASLHPLLLLVPVAGLVSLFTDGRAEVLAARGREATGEGTRRLAHYFDVATSVRFARECRVFGLGPELLARHRRESDAVRRAQVRSRLQGSCWQAVGAAVTLAAYVGGIVFVLGRARVGAAGVGDVLLAMALANQASGAIAGLAAMAAWLTESLEVAVRCLWLLDYAKGVPAGGAEAPARLEWGIALEGVSFCYPGTEDDVLSDVWLNLPAGSVVAVVGHNGAGKSTLVKLLCRFYEPTEGRITLDGVSLAGIDPEAWRARVSGAFQDSCRFELTAQEAVGLGQLRFAERAGWVDRALERAGGTAVVEALPDGKATQLGRRFDGVELSGGQWQKLALARSEMRRRPLLLVLDEPTASLDAESEFELFCRLAGAAARARRTGAVTLLVTHRFSTVRLADMIVVLDGGRVVETGSHDELVAQGGLYAGLYAAQARGYQ